MRQLGVTVRNVATMVSAQFVNDTKQLTSSVGELVDDGLEREETDDQLM
jgi:hypothetical protein